MSMIEKLPTELQKIIDGYKEAIADFLDDPFSQKELLWLCEQRKRFVTVRFVDYDAWGDDEESNPPVICKVCHWYSSR